MTIEQDREFTVPVERECADAFSTRTGACAKQYGATAKNAAKGARTGLKTIDLSGAMFPKVFTAIQNWQEFRVALRHYRPSEVFPFKCCVQANILIERTLCASSTDDS